MEYVHRCLVCGWQRPAASSTVTSPRCEHCGCALTGVLAGESTHAPDRNDPELPAFVTGTVVQAAGLVAALLLIYAAARAGYASGGPAIAVCAIGAAGLLAVMTLPAR